MPSNFLTAATVDVPIAGVNYANAHPGTNTITLAGATKKDKASSHLVYTGEAGRDAAARSLELDAKVAEMKRELDLLRDQVFDVIRPWHEERVLPRWTFTCGHRCGY